LGLPYGKWMPFVKLGVDHTASTNDLNPQSGNGVHSALGLEYKFAPHWSAQAQYEVANAKTSPGKIANKTTSIGVNYYFDSPYVAPVVAAIAAPIVMKQPEPVVAPTPAPAPVVVAPAPAPKTIFSDKPVTIEGASFDTNSAKLKPAADKKLNEVVEFAAKNKDAKLTVDGYTDSRGKEKANHALSAKRAEAVKAYLVKKGVAADRITAEGKGSANPIGDNKTKAGQALNRRVEVNSVERVAK
ncbi:MAG: OmpA family protein, partial [Gallionella sp.]